MGNLFSANKQGSDSGAPQKGKDNVLKGAGADMLNNNIQKLH
jgi:hypothetical protein